MLLLYNALYRVCCCICSVYSSVMREHSTQQQMLCRMPYAVCLMPCAVCLMPRGAQRTAANARPRSVCLMSYALCLMPYATSWHLCLYLAGEWKGVWSLYDIPPATTAPASTRRPTSMPAPGASDTPTPADTSQVHSTPHPHTLLPGTMPSV